MRLLLDTHVIVWATAQVERLDLRVAGLLSDARNELWMSSVSAWELALLSERGRLMLQPDADRWLEAAMSVSACRKRLSRTRLRSRAAAWPSQRTILPTA
jgi:PIN domain nuclease of toxin-antitoxin system